MQPRPNRLDVFYGTVLVGAVMIIAAGLAILQQTAGEKVAPVP